MPRTSSWRKALSLPVVISLALGGALLTAGPASAATEPVPSTSETAAPTESPAPAESTAPTESPAPEESPAPADEVPSEDAAARAAAPKFDMLTPTAGEVLTSQTVTFSGVGESGTVVDIAADQGDGFLTVYADDVPVVDEAWTTTITIPMVDSVTIVAMSTQQVDGSNESIERQVVFPSQAEVWNFEILSPTAGQVFTDRTVTFSGTGRDGLNVYLNISEGGRLETTVVDGTWSITATYGDGTRALVSQPIVATDGRRVAFDSVPFTLPAPPLLPSPVIETPTQGQALTGDVVTFSGTATPGTYLGIALLPTAFYNALKEELEDVANGADANARVALPEGQDAAPADPRAPILVDDNGHWSVTVAVAPGDYTAVATLIADPSEAVPVPTSAPSAPVQFTLAAAAAPAASGHGPTLAVTGADTAAPLGLAAMLLLGGLALVAVRKRRAQLS
ncbi:LPXTG cell wall anchor domain-containing protein [Plantibacter sp. CFBP 8775]|uniref:LPXTG cell wall anchor domain-containing protein n=1 Tax=Plantibacter sp. CFBP 8775 TaxID=2774038 RepID=UPI00177ED835|nr:LPXTG cell wall anchor domain-containing protein [Plantibacter sp. CFBP 8775]MBD8104065.1 LPXTG cell wall anchor domain-containing protein [Plantibacter sp. CFBP 8775]